MTKNDPKCETGLIAGIIDQETFDREIALCQKLNKEKGGGCGWGKCADCGVIALLYKLNKGELLEGDDVKRIKKEIFK